MAPLVLAAAPAPALIVRLRQRRGWVRQRAHRPPGYGIRFPFPGPATPMSGHGEVSPSRSTGRTAARTCRGGLAQRLRTSRVTVTRPRRPGGPSEAGETGWVVPSSNCRRGRGSVREGARSGPSSLASRGSGAVGAAGVAIAVVTCAARDDVVAAGDHPGGSGRRWRCWSSVAAALVDVVERRLPNRLVAAALVPVVVDRGASSWSSDVAPRRRRRGGARRRPAAGHPPRVARRDGLRRRQGRRRARRRARPARRRSWRCSPSSLGLAAGAICGLVRGARSIPLGPALVAGALAALVAGRLLDPKGLLWT